MKIRIILILLLIAVIAVVYTYYKSNSYTAIENVREDIRESIQGDRDNPEAADKFRYDMLRGNNSDVDIRQARENAISYMENSMSDFSPDAGAFSFSSIGPGNIGGRIRSIIIHPTSPNNILIGSVSGGVWKSINGGTNWSAKMTSLNPLSVGCMVIDPNNSSIVYAGTGEGWGNIDAVYGGGIYKSTDFGDTWSLLSATTIFGFRNILKMAIDGTTGKIFAITKAINYKGNVGTYTTAGGLYTSVNGGTNWTKNAAFDATATNYYNSCDLLVLSSTVQLAATNSGGIYRTSNSGANWTKMTSVLPASTGRIAMSLDPNNANNVFAVFASSTSGTPDYGLKGIYKSTDGGVNWSALTKPSNLASTGSLSYLSTQGWYDNYIAIDPYNSNNIYVGGVEIMKSTNGGTSWSQLTFWHTYYGTPYVHADHHAIAFDPVTANLIYEGNDGGIYKTANSGTNWTALNNGLTITQIYGGAVSATGSIYYAGTQDNGHLKYSGAGLNWNTVFGGDGGYAGLDQTNSNVAYEEYVYLDMSKTIDGGATWNACKTGLTEAANSSYCLFIAPFSLNPENSNVLVAGSDKVWITGNSAGSWTQSSNTLSVPGYVSAVTVVNSTANYLGFAGNTEGQIFVCTSLNPASGIDTWTNLTPTGNNGAWVRRITVDLSDKNKIYACYSGYNTSGNSHVWYSSNQGVNWTDISGDLPNVPVHSLVVDPTAAFSDAPGQTLFVGTETGIFVTTNRGINWTVFNSGMPPYLPVNELVIQSGTNKLFAFTHGGGAYAPDFPLPVELSSFVASVELNNVNLKWSTSSGVNNKGFEVQRKTDGNDLDWITLGFVNGVSNGVSIYTFVDRRLNTGKYNYRLKQIDYNGNFEYYNLNNLVSVGLPVKLDLSQNYPNPFNPATKIDFQLPADGKVSIRIYDITGREMKTLLNNEQRTAGYYTVDFNGSNLSSGMYFYRFIAQSGGKQTVMTKKMVVVK